MEKFQIQSDDPALNKCARGIESFLEATQKESLSESAQLRVLDGSQPEQYDLLKRYIKFVFVLNKAKFAELTHSLIASYNAHEFLIFALTGRSLIEHTAILRYYWNKLAAPMQKVAKRGSISPDDLEELLSIVDQFARGGRLNWHEWFEGDRAAFAKRLVEIKQQQKNRSNMEGLDSEWQKLNPHQISPQTAIDKWMKDNHGVLLAYDYFCDLVHPSLGSNFLMMGVYEDRLHVGKATNKKIALSTADEGLKLLATTAIKDAGAPLAMFSVLANIDDSGAMASNAPDRHQ